MKVKLISHTPNAVELLLFTKQTRLNMAPTLLDEIKYWPHEKKNAELAYMADTIPSSWEFVDYTFIVTDVTRAYTHQQVRTRAASYAQQSMRITDMSDFKFIFPDGIPEGSFRGGIITSAVEKIKSSYQSLINMGVRPEDARSILPTNIATNIVCKFNLRTLSELAKSRTGGRTQDEYQRVINAMIDEVLAVHPWAEQFLFQKPRDYFNELEAWAKQNIPDLKARGALLKIVDKMRKG